MTPGQQHNPNESPLPLYRRPLFWTVLEMLYLLTAACLAMSAGAMDGHRQGAWLVAVLAGYLAVSWGGSYHIPGLICQSARGRRARQALRSILLRGVVLLALAGLLWLRLPTAFNMLVLLYGVLLPGLVCAVIGRRLARRQPKRLMGVPIQPLGAPWVNLLRPMAISQGLESSRLWQLGDHESCPKAVAFCGYLRRQADIYLSQPLLSLLEPRELRAVFSHELGHVQARDSQRMSRNLVLVGLLAGVLALAVAPQVESTNRLLLSPLMAILVFRAGYLAGTIPLAAWSRRMELRACGRAMEMTGDPEALASALSALRRHNRTPAGFSRLGRFWQMQPGLAEVLAYIEDWRRPHPVVSVPPPLPAAALRVGPPPEDLASPAALPSPLPPRAGAEPLAGS